MPDIFPKPYLPAVPLEVAVVDGKGAVKTLNIDSAVVDPEDVEMLEDLVLAAVSEAQTKARAQYEEEMRKATGGLPMQLPGLF